MTNAEITVYGAHWCPDCRRSKQFLGEHQIPYNWVDIEQDPEAEQFVIEKNDGKRIIPTITFADGSFLVEPSNAELAAKLGLKTKAARSHYDLIVLGGVIAPFGREVRETEPPGGTVALIMNVIWIILPGLELAIMHLVLALLFALTIIGFPIAVQHMKLVPLALLPFGHVMRDV